MSQFQINWLAVVSNSEKNTNNFVFKIHKFSLVSVVMFSGDLRQQSEKLKSKLRKKTTRDQTGSRGTVLLLMVLVLVLQESHRTNPHI